MRVSTEDQADRGTIDAQRDFLRQFANLYQLPIADEYADDGVSGTLSLGERPEGQRLLYDAETGAFGSVVVYRLTRLGRSLKALTEAHDRLAQLGVTIRSATEPFDTSTPIGTFLFQLLGSLTELDRAQMLEQLNRGRDRVARDGKWTGGPVPFGYAMNQQGKLVASTRQVLVLDMTEADLIRDVYERIARGSSGVTEARRLNALGVPTTRYYRNGRVREGGKKWHPSRIAKIIAMEVYRGVHVLDSRYGAIEREVAPKPLVDTVLWEQANAQLKRNRRLPKSNATRIYLLRGLITCGQCGSTYVGQAYTSRKGTRGAYYRCCRGNAGHYTPEERCRARVVNTEWLERTVWEDCRTVILNPGEVLADVQRQLHNRIDEMHRVEQERGHYIEAIKEKAQERERIMTLFRRGRLALQDAEAYLDDIGKEEAVLRQHCNALDAQKALAEAFDSHFAEASLLLQDFQDRLEYVDRTNDEIAKQRMIQLLVHGIRIDINTNRELTATITYVFTPMRVANISAATDAHRRGGPYGDDPPRCCAPWPPE
jgi:site-specific DNA recombinase